MSEEKVQKGDLLKELREENTRLNTVSANLLKSRDAALKEAEKLRWLVRRMLPSVKFHRAAAGSLGTLGELVEEARGVVYGEGKVCDDFALGMGALRQTMDQLDGLHKALMDGKKMGEFAFLCELDGFVDRLEMVESMLMGDGAWRKQKGFKPAEEWMEREKRMQEAANGKA